ncbi:hypothetical protein Ancab_019091 [Ancistrocladus abbreviatus]
MFREILNNLFSDVRLRIRLACYLFVFQNPMKRLYIKKLFNVHFRSTPVSTPVKNKSGSLYNKRLARHQSC